MHLYFVVFVYSYAIKVYQPGLVPEIITEGAVEISEGALVLMHIFTYFVLSIAMAITMSITATSRVNPAYICGCNS